MRPHDLADVGQRIVALELPADATFDEVVAGSERVFVALRERLGRWIGADAFDALLDRALLHARTQHAVLGTARWRPHGTPPLVGLARTAGEAPEVAARAALAATLDALTTQLGRFIGSDLATRLVLDGWHRPAPPLGQIEEP